VIGDEVDEETQTSPAELLRERSEAFVSAQLGVDLVVRADVVSVRAPGLGAEIGDTKTWLTPSSAR
jgi:hypothetical protein